MIILPFQAKVYIEVRNSFVKTNHSVDLPLQMASFVARRIPSFGRHFSKQQMQDPAAHEATMYRVLVFSTSNDVVLGLLDWQGRY